MMIPLGLSPASADRSDSFIQMINQRGIIDTASSGVYYEDTKNQADITFGGIDTDMVPNFDNLTFTDLYENDSWSVNITSIRYGDSEFSILPNYGLINIEIPPIAVPPEEYAKIVSEA